MTLEDIADRLIKALEWTGFSSGESISYELGALIKELELIHGLKDDHLPWEEFDKDESFQELIDFFASCCTSDDATNTLAIFCLDRGLFYCQMGSLKDEAYDEYLLSAVVNAKKLSE